MGKARVPAQLAQTWAGAGRGVAHCASTPAFFTSAAKRRVGKLEYAICGLIGIVTSLAFVYITQYYTAGSYRPG